MEFLRVFKGFDGKTFICHPLKECTHAIRYLNPSGDKNIKLDIVANNGIITYRVKNSFSNRWCRTEPFERSSGA